MMAEFPAVTLLHAACAAIYAVLVALILVRARLSRTGLMLAGACLVTVAWSTAIALQWSGPLSGLVGWLEIARSVAWYCFILHLYRRTVSPGRQIGQTVANVGLAVMVLIGAAPLLDVLVGQYGPSLWSVEIVARLGLAICNLLLIENLYFNTREDARWHINLLCIALGGLFLYDLVLYSDALLFRRLSPLLFEGRASVTAMVAPLIAVAAARNRTWKIDIHVSRTVVFHSASLVASGVFLLALAAAGQVLRESGAEWGVVAETSIIFGGLVTVAVLLTSGSARSKLRALVVEHFFSLRYDYRREWMRCIQILSSPESYVGLQSRAIRAVAEVVDSPGGALFVRDSRDTAFVWAGSWNVPAATMPVPLGDELIAAFREGNWIVELNRDAQRHEWAGDLANLWLAVPLNHLGQLIGFVLVTASRASFRLDREAYDLLRIVGREVASHVAEQRARQVLAETRELQEYGRRFAFVVHDIKNVSSQLSMLLSNAEIHADNPDFQRDMLKTVRASVAKITALLARLQAGDREAETLLTVPVDRLTELVATCSKVRGMEVGLRHDGRTANVVMDPGSFDAVVTHLLDNAVEAAAGRGPVTVTIRHDPLSVTIDVTDSGAGMSPEFIRDRLFVPFASTKRGGHGIGVYQARVLLREAGGDLLVISRRDVGTTMRILLPSVAATVEEPSPVSA